MSPDDIRTLRKDLGLTQRQLAEALKLDANTVRAWETEALFPTRAHCDAMTALRANPPPKVPKNQPTPLQVLADPKFFLLLRKLIAHPKLRAEVERLAAEHPDPLDA
jgi:transcriptional regulator with XRE-family HTH domain